MSKLALGTAQFGMNYGIGSTSGKLEIGQVQEILKYARLANIDMLDTAPSYGNSEKILGEVNVVDLKVVSKTRHIKNLKITDEDLLSLNHDFETSLIDLKLDSIYGLLIHNTDDLIKPGASKIIKFLENLKKVKKIEKIGISIYDSKQLSFVLENFDIDIVQLPLNIFDRRLINNGMLKLLRSKGIEIHARSIFLQGLALMPDNIRPRKFDRWNNLWKSWHEWLNDHKISPLEASIRYAMSIQEISKVLVGVDLQSQLVEIVSATSGFLPEIPDDLFSNDKLLLNPSNWDAL